MLPYTSTEEVLAEGATSKVDTNEKTWVATKEKTLLETETVTLVESNES